MVTDPISDFLTQSKERTKRRPQSGGNSCIKIKKEITKILFDQGYIFKLQV